MTFGFNQACPPEPFLMLMLLIYIGKENRRGYSHCYLSLMFFFFFLLFKFESVLVGWMFDSTRNGVEVAVLALISNQSSSFRIIIIIMYVFYDGLPWQKSCMRKRKLKIFSFYF
jgi:hypothetical protein